MRKLGKFVGMGAVAAAFGMPLASAQEIDAFDVKRCVNIGNTLEAPADGSWGGSRDVVLSEYKLIAGAGFDTVRIPIRWSDYTGPAPDYTIDPAFMDKVKTAVDGALAQGLNVMINVHHFEGMNESPPAHIRELVAIWRQVGAVFAEYPDDLWFETFNEPNGDVHRGELMRAVQRATVLAIRETNPTRIVVVGGEDWSGLRSLASNIEPTDENFVYTYHYYDPFDFTHQFAPWTGDSMPNKKRGWGSREDRRQLAADVETAKAFRAAVGHPVFVGEFGAYERIDNRERVKYVGGVRTALEEAGIPWCLWAWANTFPLYNRDKGEWDTDMVEALGLTVPTQE